MLYMTQKAVKQEQTAAVNGHKIISVVITFQTKQEVIAIHSRKNYWCIWQNMELYIKLMVR